MYLCVLGKSGKKETKQNWPKRHFSHFTFCSLVQCDPSTLSVSTSGVISSPLKQKIKIRSRPHYLFLGVDKIFFFLSSKILGNTDGQICQQPQQQQQHHYVIFTCCLELVTLLLPSFFVYYILLQELYFYQRLGHECHKWWTWRGPVWFSDGIITSSKNITLSQYYSYSSKMCDFKISG